MTIPDSSIAAFWSAVAASFSALAATAAFLIQRRNLLESVRPELVIIGWQRLSRGEGEMKQDIIEFKSVKNVGRGAGLHVNIYCMPPNPFLPVAAASTVRMPILAPNETTEVEGHISLWWNNVPPQGDGPRMIPLNVRILAWDSRGMRHDTRYTLAAFEIADNHFLTDVVAPSVMLLSRRTISVPVWRLKLYTWFGRVPFFGRPFKRLAQ